MRRWILLGVLSLTLGGCATLPNGRGWGEDATLVPGWSRVGHALQSAGRSPGTWAPLAGALLVQIDHADERLSDWASENTPVFGSQQTADARSTDLANGCQNLYYLTALTLPSGKQPASWAGNKIKGLAVGYVASEAVSVATDWIKDETDRQRPDGRDRKSFPSGHTSRATSFATLTARNLDYLPLPSRTSIISKTGVYSLAAAAAWARVEAKRHYPSDVLAGAALSHFLSLFIYDSFLGLDSAPLVPSVTVMRDEVHLGLTCSF